MLKALSFRKSPGSSFEEQVQLKWYHTTLFNACIIGGVGFMAPGLWNAMNSLGAGGAQEPYLVNSANALVFALSTTYIF
jgi:hypothetical protein